MNTQERIEKVKESWAKNFDVVSVIKDVNNLLNDDEFQAKHIESVDCGSSRWYRHMLEVIEIDEDVFIGVSWDSGLTESQEDMYEDTDVYPLGREVIEVVDWTIGKAL